MAQKKATNQATAGIESGIDPEDIARTELAGAMVPTPDDIVEMLSPLASMLYLQQLAWANFQNWTAWLADMTPEQQADAQGATKVLQVNAQVCGLLDAICETVGLTPVKTDAPAFT